MSSLAPPPARGTAGPSPGGATPEELIAQWLDPATATIMQPGLHGAGLLRPKVLHEKARELFARFRPRLPFGLTLAEIPRLRPHLVRDRPSRGSTWRPPVPSRSAFRRWPSTAANYVDGGLLGALPLWAAGEMGATRAIALNVLNRLPFALLRNRAAAAPARLPARSDRISSHRQRLAP